MLEQFFKFHCFYHVFKSFSFSRYFSYWYNQNTAAGTGAAYWWKTFKIEISWYGRCFSSDIQTRRVLGSLFWVCYLIFVTFQNFTCMILFHVWHDISCVYMTSHMTWHHVWHFTVWYVFMFSYFRFCHNFFFCEMGFVCITFDTYMLYTILCILYTFAMCV